MITAYGGKRLTAIPFSDEERVLVFCCSGKIQSAVPPRPLCLKSLNEMASTCLRINVVAIVICIYARVVASDGFDVFDAGLSDVPGQVACFGDFNSDKRYFFHFLVV